MNNNVLSEIDPVQVSNSNSNEDTNLEDTSNNSISEHINRSLDSYSNVNDNFSISNNREFNINSSLLIEIFKFLLCGRYNHYNSREWKYLCKCQIKKWYFIGFSILDGNCGSL